MRVRLHRIFRNLITFHWDKCGIAACLLGMWVNFIDGYAHQTGINEVELTWKMNKKKNNYFHIIMASSSKRCELCIILICSTYT